MPQVVRGLPSPGKRRENRAPDAPRAGRAGRGLHRCCPAACSAIQSVSEPEVPSKAAETARRRAVLGDRRFLMILPALQERKLALALAFHSMVHGSILLQGSHACRAIVRGSAQGRPVGIMSNQVGLWHFSDGQSSDCGPRTEITVVCLEPRETGFHDIWTEASVSTVMNSRSSQ